MTVTEPYRQTSTHVMVAIFPVPDLTSIRAHGGPDEIVSIDFAEGRGFGCARLQFHNPAEARAWLTDTLTKLDAVADPSATTQPSDHQEPS